MKIVLCGPSGSGKTTLAKAIAKELGFNFQENSAGLILDKDVKEGFVRDHGYAGIAGQRDVINLSHSRPSFGLEFQQQIMKARHKLAKQEGDWVYDRSSIDPLAYFLNQCVHNHSEDECQKMIANARLGMQGIDIVIRVPLQNPEKTIEDDGSRVANYYFQRKMDWLFDLALNFMAEPNVKRPYRLWTVPTWNWDQRLEWSVRTIKQYIKDPSL